MKEDNFESEEFYIKVVGKANIPEPLEIGTNYNISCDGTITEKREEDAFNGTHLYTFKFEPVHIVIVNETGKTIRAKDPRKNSVRFRNYCFKVWNNHEAILHDFDRIYDEVILVAMSEMPELMNEALKRIKEREV
mgnify:CR=1 FL=1